MSSTTPHSIPTFTVSRIEGERTIGVTDRKLWLSERALGDLLLPNETWVCGRFVDVDLESLRASFVPTIPVELSLLRGGETYRRFDGYWGEKAAMVLDRELRWSERAFEPSDAIAQEQSGGTLISVAVDAEVPAGGKLIAGGWDHEHCELCWATISLTTNRTAIISNRANWVCLRCYGRFIVPRSLDFIHIKPDEC